MSGIKSLAVIVAVASMTIPSIAQAAGANSRKHVRPPAIASSDAVRNSHAEMPQAVPAWSYQGVRGLSSPGGRG